MAVRKNVKTDDGNLPHLERYELIDKINRLKSLRNKALVCFLYLSGCRIQECCKYNIEIAHKRIRQIKQEDGSKIKVNQPILETVEKGLPIQKKQFEFRENHIIVKNVRNLKRRNKPLLRSIPILYKTQEIPFINILEKYLNTLEDDDYLFPITRQRAYQILSKIDLYCHWLRHLRMTDLVTDYGFNEEYLRQFTGWTSGKPAAEYVHLDVKDLVAKMQKG